MEGARSPGNKGDFPAGLWIGIGAFFLVLSCAPLGTDYRGLVFFWDLFAIGGNTVFGAAAVYVLAAGVALIVVANVAAGVARGAITLAIGAGGIVVAVLAVAGGTDGLPGAEDLKLGDSASALIPALVSVGALLFALAGNNVRIHHPGSRLGKMLGGIGACVAGTLLLVAFVMGAVRLHADVGPVIERHSSGLPAVGVPVLPFMLSTYPVPQLVCGVPLLLACVLMGMNLAESPKARRRARSAQKLAFVGLGLLAAWMIVGPTIAAVMDGRTGDALWGGLGRVRMIGVPCCFALMVGGGVAEAARAARSRPRERGPRDGGRGLRDNERTPPARDAPFAAGREDLWGSR